MRYFSALTSSTIGRFISSGISGIISSDGIASSIAVSVNPAASSPPRICVSV